MMLCTVAHGLLKARPASCLSPTQAVKTGSRVANSNSMDHYLLQRDPDPHHILGPLCTVVQNKPICFSVQHGP